MSEREDNVDNKTKYKHLRNLNITIAGASLGISYYLKRKKHGFLALIPAISAGKFLVDAYDNNYQKRAIEADEKRIEDIIKKGPIK